MSEAMKQLYAIEIEQAEATINQLDSRMGELLSQRQATNNSLNGAKGKLETLQRFIDETNVAGVIQKARLETARSMLAQLKTENESS